MRGSGHGASPRAKATIAAATERARDLHAQYATALFRQAILTLADAALAEQVVCEVIVEECIRRPHARPEAETARHQLAVSAYRRCQEVPAVTARSHRAPPAPRALPVLPGTPALSRAERGALALVLFGGLGYVGAARAAGISAPSMAGLLRKVLLGRAEPADARA
ncbi:MAG TPA: hypothetical protein VIJ82_27180 [Streptosporangiaceae bacterium]|jgi:hypothetical protein